MPGSDDEPSPPDPGAGIGPEKCVFIYNANKNRFNDNWFEGCEIGIHFTAGSERNEIAGNAFISNRNQVKYVSTRYLDWSKEDAATTGATTRLSTSMATASPTAPIARTTSSTRCSGPRRRPRC